MSKKVLIIGLDGGTWKVFNKLFKDASMPFMDGLIKKSSLGILKSTIPPITPVAWSSFQTGAGPEIHGIFGFSNFSKKNKKFELINSSLIKVPTIWEYLSLQGKKVISINVPVTFPPKPVNGFMITGMFTPGVDSEYTYPATLKKEIVAKFGNFPFLEGMAVYNKDKNISGFVNTCVEMIKKQTDIAKYLMQKNQWDVFMMHYQMTDALQHPLWCFIDETHPQYKSDIYNNIKPFYESLDYCITELVNLAKAQGTDHIVFMSDHGFQTNRKTFYINNWLFKCGFLKTKGIFLNSFIKILRMLYRKTLLGISKTGLRKRFKNFEQSFAIDWERTIAYASANNSYAQIYFGDNIKEADKSKLIDTLMGIKDTDNGHSFFETYYTKYDLYGAVDIEYMPDLVFVPRDGNSCLATFDRRLIFKTNKFPYDYQIGNHHPDGIFAVLGDGVSMRKELSGSIIDVYPTILFMLGVEIPSYISGKVILDAFSDQYLRENGILFSSNQIQRAKDEFDYTDSDKSEIEKSLRNLGYL